MRKLVFGVSDQVRLKPGCTWPQKMVRGLKFPIKEVEGLYSLCSEDKGLGQLHGYTAPLWGFLHIQKAGFCIMRLNACSC